MDPTPALTATQLRKARAAKLPAGHPERDESTRIYAVERAVALTFETEPDFRVLALLPSP